MEEVYQNLLSLFNKNNWKSSSKVVQKQAEYMFNYVKTFLYEKDDDKMLYIYVGDLYKYDDDFYDKSICNNKQFVDVFESICKYVIDKNFELNTSYDDFYNEFIEDQHGSGVMSLFWVVYTIARYKDVNKFVIDGIDGFLHPLSMIQLHRAFSERGAFRFIFLMNNDTLFTSSVSDIDDLYVMHGTKIDAIRNCTDRELRPAHNLQNLLRAGEFDG